MGDLIDRDAVLHDVLTECSNAHEAKYYEAQVALTRAKRIICDAPAVNRWIACSERLPEDDENVLVYILTSHMNFISLAHIHKGVFRAAWNHDKITNVEITHWMPLPEIPEPSEKE